MMIRIAGTLLLLLLFSACAPVETSATPTPEFPPPPQPYVPQPGDDLMARGEFYLDNASLLIMESYPLQINLQVTGNLPTPCHHLRVTVAPPDQDGRINVEVFSVADPNALCAQVLEPVDTSIPLGSFPPGHYSVWVNGQLAGEFDA